MGQGKSMQEAMDEVQMVVEGVYSAKASRERQILAGDIRAIQQCAGGDTCCLSEKHRDLSSDQQALL